MSQPPKSTLRAPAATWVSASGVRFREADMDRLRCGGIARVTEYAGLPEGPGSGWISAPLCFCLRVAPRVIRGFAPSAPGPRTILPARQVSPECCFSLMADRPWADAARYGLPERFRANCAFGGGSGDHGRSLPRLA